MKKFKTWIMWMERRKWKRLFEVRKRKPLTEGAFGIPAHIPYTYWNRKTGEYVKND